MSQPNNRAANEFSVELCALIDERDVLQDVSENMMELLKEANVSFQNSDGNTLLHLAIAKKDMKCVEVLLKLKPDVNIKNSDGKTQKDLATEVNCGAISSLMNNYEIEVEFVNGARAKFDQVALTVPATIAAPKGPVRPGA